MKIQKHVKVELLRKKAARPIEAVQYDTGNQIIFELIDFDLPTGTTATLYIQKPSGKFVYQEDGIAIADNEITVDLHNQALTEHGKVYYQVRLENVADLITTFTGLMFVEKSLADAGATESRTVLAAFAELTAEKIAEIQAAAAQEKAEMIAAIQRKSEDEQEAIRNTGAAVLATIPADYTETHAIAEEAVRTKADGIVCSANGERITVNDSSDMPLQGLKLLGKTEQIKTTGKNLLDVSQIVGRAAIINNNGTITVTTPAASSAVSTDKTLAMLAPLLEVGNTYILTFNSTGSDKYIYLEGAKYRWNNGVSVTITQEMLDSVVLLYASGVGTTATITDLMIRLASVTDATWEPYTGGKPSPSPDYPQDLVSVGEGGSVTITIEGAESDAIQTLTAQTPNGLAGKKVDSKTQATHIDSNGDMWRADEWDAVSGTMRKAFAKIELDGTENGWKQNSNVPQVFGIVPAGIPILANMAMDSGGKNAPVICSHFAQTKYVGSGLLPNGMLEVYAGSNGNAVQFKHDGCSTLDAWKAFLKAESDAGHPVTLLVGVKTITETPLTAEEIAAYRALHSNYPNTTVFNGDGAGMEVEYVADTKLYIDNKFAQLAARLIENT